MEHHLRQSSSLFVMFRSIHHMQELLWDTRVLHAFQVQWSRVLSSWVQMISLLLGQNVDCRIPLWSPITVILQEWSWGTSSQSSDRYLYSEKHTVLLLPWDSSKHLGKVYLQLQVEWTIATASSISRLGWPQQDNIDSVTLIALIVDPLF